MSDWPGLAERAPEYTAIEDGFLEYFLIFPDAAASSLDLNVVIRDCLAVLEGWTSGQYIWHVESPILRAESSTKSPTTPMLHGKFEFGDNIDDEWLAIAWLFECSRRLRDFGVAIHTFDNDGDILLIETAEVLPAYIDPDDATWRTYTIDGQVHYIPGSIDEEMPVEMEETLRRIAMEKVGSAQAGANHVRSHLKETLLPPACQTALQARLLAYPAQALACMHVSRCQLPEVVARLLSRDPQLVSAAVGAFYNRDTEDVKAASEMRYFKPRNGFTPMSVPMTRNLYAKLAGQVYIPPKKYRAALPPAVLEALAVPSASKGRTAATHSTGEAELDSYLRGAKICAGFEMLLTDRRIRARLDGVISGKEIEVDTAAFERFSASLKARGFYASCVTAEQIKSRRHEALKYFQEHAPASLDGSSLTQRILKHVTEDARILSALREEKIVGAGHEEPPGYTWPPSSQRDDPPTWMKEAETAHRALDGMLGGTAGEGMPDISGDEFSPLRDLLQQFASFVGKQSDYRGVTEEDAGSDTDDNSSGDDTPLEESEANKANEGFASRLPIGRPLTVEDVLEAFTGENAIGTPATSVILASAEPESQWEWVAKDGLRHTMQSSDEQLDSELKTSFIRAAGARGPMDEAEVDLNLLSNLARSVSAQSGLAGPASTLATSIKAKIPTQWWTLVDRMEGKTGPVDE